MNFKQKLTAKIEATGSCLCLGIDPHLDELPNFFLQTVKSETAIKAVEKFSNTLLLACKDKVPAVKFQSSFFEAFGWQGFKLLSEQIALAKSLGMITILDAKRGDISSTMKAYGQMAFEEMKADCLTITPYMGMDVIKPLVPWIEKGAGIYVVWLTSNPSGLEIQNFENVHKKKLIEFILDQLDSTFDEYVNQSIGLVLGATKLEIIEQELLNRASKKSLLVPGFGTQGGVATDSFQMLLKQKQHLIPVSRGIAGIGDPQMRLQLEQLSSWEDYFHFVKGNCEKFNSQFVL